ncbi:MAG TPA: DoxX family membrane protein [Cytophagaceae bacterium]|jgi:putative oxidoreductase|nr:DoxX family membrane protein [Cytophagaceae bacterium]
MELLVKREREFINKVNSWSERHRKSGAFAVLRVLLGILLLGAGIAFVHTDKLPSMLYNSVGFGSWAFSSFIIMMQFAAGFMIGVGLKTRYLAIAMIPILLGAVVMESMTHGQAGLVLSLIALIGVLFFALFDSGYYSADRALRKEIEEEEKFFNR